MTRAGEKRRARRFLVGKPEQRDKWENPGLHEKIIFTCIFKKYFGGLRDKWPALV